MDRRYRYAIRLTANPVLERHIEHLLTRPVGRPPNKPQRFYHSFEYQAQPWNRPRRVVAKVEWHQGELFPRVGFIVTNLDGGARRVNHFYNQRGTAEQWIKEGKYGVKWTRLSCCSFDANQVRLQLYVLAYNLANFLRRLALPASVKHWALTTLREKLIKIGTKVVQHARCVSFQLAEVAIPRPLFAAILRRIERLRLSPLRPWSRHDHHRFCITNHGGTARLVCQHQAKMEIWSSNRPDRPVRGPSLGPIYDKIMLRTTVLTR